MVLMRLRELRIRHPYAGVRKLQKMLANPDYGLPIIIGRDRLFDLLRKTNLLSKLYKRYKKTTISKHQLPTHPNLIKDIKVTAVNGVWVSDITYIRLPAGKFCYLFLVSDLYSRKILGYALKESLASEGAEQALRMALSFAKPQSGFIHHSDHGIQYCCKSYIAALEKQGARISMTGDNHCYDNAVAERINGILKQEYGLGQVLPSLDAANLLVTDGIKIYNSERLHASLGYNTPNKIYELSIKTLKIPA